jgi:hypothetical protein
MKTRILLPAMLLAGLGPAGLRAAAVYNIDVDTWTIGFNNNEKYSLEFQFNQGQGGSPYNVAVVDSFDFGTSYDESITTGPSGPPDRTGDAWGDLATSVTMGTRSFFQNRFVQQFVPPIGYIHFRLTFTTRYAGDVPDQFSMAILAGDARTEIPTFDPWGTNTMLSMDIDTGNLTVNTYQSEWIGYSSIWTYATYAGEVPDPPLPGGGQGTETPEPAGYCLLGAGLLLLAKSGRRKL